MCLVKAHGPLELSPHCVLGPGLGAECPQGTGWSFCLSWAHRQMQQTGPLCSVCRGPCCDWGGRRSHRDRGGTPKSSLKRIIGTIPERRSMGHSREKKGTGGNKQHGLWELLESALPGSWALGDVPDAGWQVGLGRWPWMPGPGAWTLSWGQQKVTEATKAGMA